MPRRMMFGGYKWRPKYHLPLPFKELPFIGVGKTILHPFLTDYIEGNFGVLKIVAIANPLVNQKNGDLVCNWYVGAPNGGKLINDNNFQQYAYNKGTGARTITFSYLEKCIKIEVEFDKLKGEIRLNNGTEIITTKDAVLRCGNPYLLFGRYFESLFDTDVFRGHFAGVQMIEDGVLKAQFVPCELEEIAYLYNIVTGYYAPVSGGILPYKSDYDRYVDYDF